MILSGIPVRDSLKKALVVDFASLPRIPELAIIQIGDNPASTVYINQKVLFGAALGVPVRHIILEENSTEKEIKKVIHECNNNSRIGGIIIQLPLPTISNHVVFIRGLLDCILPEKDVDGLGTDAGGLLLRQSTDVCLPATARGIMSLFEYYKIDLSGKHVVVVGRSDLVGKPVALMALAHNATVTVCHSYTDGLREITRSADILIVAVGKPRYIDASYVKEGQVVIDVGIHRIDGKICGDVDFETVEPIVYHITPVPGGVGPLTVVSLFQNLLDIAKRQV